MNHKVLLLLVMTGMVMTGPYMAFKMGQTLFKAFYRLNYLLHSTVISMLLFPLLLAKLEHREVK